MMQCVNIVLDAIQSVIDHLQLRRDQNDTMRHLDEESIEQIIQDPETQTVAAEALAQIRETRESTIPNAAALDACAALLGQERGNFWVYTLKNLGHMETFVAALRGRGLAVNGWELNAADIQFDKEKLRFFLGQVDTFRCKIRVGGEVKGSGILVGPSSALTAWHVVANAAPDVPLAATDIAIELADGRTIPAVPLPVSSPCGDVEWPPGGGRIPKSDEEVHERHDVALLRLREPAGIHLSYAPLASPAYAYGGPAAVVLISHPNGEWNGVEFAKLRKLRNLTARWGYDVQGNLGGSSGGGCFDTRFSLAGIHQGRAGSGGRLVPLIRFDSSVRQAIAEDVTPQVLWSLDGTPDSDVVVGRDAFFKGYHAAMQGPQRVRGLWIRRIDLQHDVSGLPFSYELLAKLVARTLACRLMRVSFDVIIHDLPDEIARRAAVAGLAVMAPETHVGVGLDHTEPEAVVADRSRRLAQSLEDKATALNIRLWVFFDHPSAAFGDELRWALTAFVDQAMRCDHLRVVLAGYEAVQMPGEEFQQSYQAQGNGGAGFMVEYLADLQPSDVRNLIESAASQMDRPITPERVTEWTNEALQGLISINNRYDSKLRAEIGRRLQPKFQQLRDEGKQT